MSHTSAWCALAAKGFLVSETGRRTVQVTPALFASLLLACEEGPHAAKDTDGACSHCGSVRGPGGRQWRHGPSVRSRAFGVCDLIHQGLLHVGHVTLQLRRGLQSRDCARRVGTRVNAADRSQGESDDSHRAVAHSLSSIFVRGVRALHRVLPATCQSSRPPQRIPAQRDGSGWGTRCGSGGPDSELFFVLALTKSVCPPFFAITPVQKRLQPSGVGEQGPGERGAPRTGFPGHRVWTTEFFFMF